MNFRGNRWYKCDLHIHTPVSKCFADSHVTAEHWVQACIDKGLEVVAVTDHNSGNYIDQIMEAAQGTNLTVFPGVEITCDTSKVHLLILFDKDKRASDINAFLHYCGIQDHKFAEQDATTEVSETIFTVAEKAHNRGAIIIPAHIDEYNGISETSYQMMESFLNKPYINGVQVVNEEIYNHQKYPTIQERLNILAERYPSLNEEKVKNWSNAVKLSKEKNKAILTFSDNPSGPKQSTHGLWGIGNRYTWIKMEENVSLESLRQALLIPQQKIRNDFDHQSYPYVKPEFLFKGLVVQNTILNPGKSLNIPFNPQLNSIIGGRGTGKSAIIRIIRGLLNNNNDLIDFRELLEEQTNFFKQSETSRIGDENKGILTSDSIIELHLERLNRTYKIVFSNFQKDQFTKTVYKINTEGVAEISDETILDLFDAEIYSQKQIYNIATRPNALREKIDQSIPTLNELNNSIEETINKYFITSNKIRNIKNRIDKESRILTEKIDIEERLLSFKEKGYQNILNAQKGAESDNLLLQRVINDLEKKEGRIQEYIQEFTYINYDSFEFTEEANEELREILAGNSTEFQEAINKLTEVSTTLVKIKDSFFQAINNSTWKKQFDTVKSDFKTLQEELSPNELNDIENIESLSNQLKIKEQELENIQKDKQEIVSLTVEIKNISDSYLELRKKVTLERKNFLQSVLADTPNIKIDVKAFRDSENYENKLREILQRPDTFIEDFQAINEIVFRGQVEAKIEDLRNIIINIRESGQNYEGFSGRFNTLIKGINDEQIDKVNLLYPEDKIEVHYRANDASDFKSISNASAGQKTSAILTFLLSYGNAPLLLDQPEDDLDNQLIYELIVDRLSHSKNKRQIIVVTHNANIPVNGDSEWVIAMNSESKDIEVLCEGAIENPRVKDAICTIMEGGSDAFKLRAKRYKLEI